jgi:hypothetical protein
MRHKRVFMHTRNDARYVEAGEDRVITELVSEHPPVLLEYARDHNVSALGDEAARAWLAPIPRAAPVTITVRLSKRFTIVSPLTITPHTHVRPLVEVCPSDGDAWLSVPHAH